MDGSSSTSTNEESDKNQREDAKADLATADTDARQKQGTEATSSIRRLEHVTTDLIEDEALKWMVLLLRITFLVPHTRAERVVAAVAMLVPWLSAVQQLLFLVDLDAVEANDDRAVLLTNSALWHVLTGCVRLWLLLCVPKQKLCKLFKCLLRSSYWHMKPPPAVAFSTERLNRTAKIWSIVCFCTGVLNWALLFFGYFIGAEIRLVINYPYAQPDGQGWTIQEEEPGIYWWAVLQLVLQGLCSFAWIVPLLPYSLAVGLLHERFRHFGMALDHLIPALGNSNELLGVHRDTDSDGQPTGKVPSLAQLTVAHRQLCQAVLVVDRIFRPFVATWFSVNSALTIFLIYRIVFFREGASSTLMGSFFFWLLTGLLLQGIVGYKAAKIYAWHDHLLSKCLQIQLPPDQHTNAPPPTPPPLAAPLTSRQSSRKPLLLLRSHSLDTSIAPMCEEALAQSTHIVTRREETSESGVQRELELLRFAHQVSNLRPGLTVGGAVLLNWQLIGTAASVVASVFVFLYETRKGNTETE
ncbi:unnamed protein product [Vitrella brassicaformis CCMP3155]|uniref:Uncharacterized protein n=1 Tax=Vitrella brassicaformis (strain CCMP3155) TaxID=1169540 RepID=A0A0G4FIT4_VITBC|nr:unnamed protein product [Vitrella brassicaformis CCMP3155]|mmetsp:Transcript_31904/g.92406  ORF Transcript_31904/g.92406 Transcript_31904/m.92406 type:complete len:526 (-) Transcript_31904:715-2292(-)|eukprot:CEM13019.1 unnamed protein product [Vitrella brassicaformis CCMP3155]